MGQVRGGAGSAGGLAGSPKELDRAQHMAAGDTGRQGSEGVFGANVTKEGDPVTQEALQADHTPSLRPAGSPAASSVQSLG